MADTKKEIEQQNMALTEKTQYSIEKQEEYKKPITINVIKALRAIGRKSINDFTEEDLQMTQKWAYKFYQELGTKSPFFRAWFGDWRVYDLSPLEKIIIGKEDGTLLF